jgi:hypothetical protein
VDIAAEQRARTRMKSLPTSASAGPCSATPSGHGEAPRPPCHQQKSSRDIRAIVATISIPDHPFHDEAGSATDQPVGSEFRTPIPRLRGAILRAERHSCSPISTKRARSPLNHARLRAASNSFASGPAEAGFCPVMRRPSTTTRGCQLDVDAYSAPSALSASSSSKGTSSRA